MMLRHFVTPHRRMEEWNITICIGLQSKGRCHVPIPSKCLRAEVGNAIFACKYYKSRHKWEVVSVRPSVRLSTLLICKLLHLHEKVPAQFNYRSWPPSINSHQTRETETTDMSLQSHSSLRPNATVMPRAVFEPRSSRSADWVGYSTPSVQLALHGRLQGRRQSYSCNRPSRLPHFLDNRLTDGGDAVGLTRRPTFTSTRRFLYSVICVTTESTRSHTCSERKASPWATHCSIHSELKGGPAPLARAPPLEK
jgi:hypothetical protein